MVDLTAAEVYRDYVTDGVPSSGAHNPKKVDVRKLHAQYESIINAITSNGGLIYSSKALLDADLAKAANTMAWVLGDPVAANNGVYGKLGASGGGSWTRRADLPFSFIIASNVGAGTPNAIQATTSIPVSGSALVWMNIAAANTGPVTVSFNGGSAIAVKTHSGADVFAGGLLPGMIVLGVVSGGVFRLVSDQASSAIIAAAEAAAASAEAAVASVNTRQVADRAALKALNTTGASLAFLTEAGREGAFKWTVGDFSSLVALDPYEAVYVKADAVAATSGAWVRQDDWLARGLVLSWAGVVANYVPGVSLGTDQSARIQSLFYLAGAIGVGAVVAAPGYYHVASGLKLPAGVAFICNGAVAAHFVAGGVQRTLGCVLVGVGNAAKAYSIANDDAGAGYEFGGAINNPSKAMPYTATHGGRSDVYQITDLTNGNAVGATRATPRQFSALLKFNRGCRLENITVTNNCGGNPAWGYSGPDFGDEWDVGLWGNASEGSILNDCGAPGYWRIAGLLDSTYTGVETADEGGAITPQLDKGERNRCLFSGHAGLSLSDKPRHKMTAVTANTIQIAWSKSHRWPTSGTCRTPSTVYTYTGLTFSGDKLTFTGVTPSPAGESVPGEIYYNTNTFGMAQITYNHCHFGDMTHTSNRYCVDNYFGANAMPTQSCAMEISGRGARQPTFINCTWHAIEDRCWHLHDVRQMSVIGGWAEGRTAVDQSGASLPRASRFIGLKTSSLLHSALYPMQGARQLRIQGLMVGEMHVGPAFRSEATAIAKFGASGLFDPDTTWWDIRALGIEFSDTSGATNGFTLQWHPKIYTPDYSGSGNNYLAVVSDAVNSGADKYPIGTEIMVFTGTTVDAVNSTRTIYIDSTQAGRFTIFSGSNTQLQGEWRHRGIVHSNATIATGPNFAKYQRVA